MQRQELGWSFSAVVRSQQSIMGPGSRWLTSSGTLHTCFPNGDHKQFRLFSSTWEGTCKLDFNCRSSCKLDHDKGGLHDRRSVMGASVCSSFSLSCSSRVRIGTGFQWNACPCSLGISLSLRGIALWYMLTSGLLFSESPNQPCPANSKQWIFPCSLPIILCNQMPKKRAERRKCQLRIVLTSRSTGKGMQNWCPAQPAFHWNNKK